MHKIYTVPILFILMFLYTLEPQESYAQNNVSDKNAAQPLDTYQKTLLYGIDTSVIQILETMSTLSIDGFEDLILQRMKETSNADLIIAGFNYFDAVAYEGAIEYATDIVLNFTEHVSKSVQYATFYIKNNHEQLAENVEQLLRTVILDIVDTENPAIALAALEMLPTFYTEQDIPYVGTTLEQNTDNFISNTYSDQLLLRYNQSKVPGIQEQILIVLGAIQAHNALDFLIQLSQSNTTNTGLRSQALVALARFQDLDDRLTGQRDTAYRIMRSHDIPNIRVATIEAISSVLHYEENFEYLEWIRDAMRDSNVIVRKKAVESLKNVFEHSTVSTTFQDNSWLENLEYIAQEDPETQIQNLAVQALLHFPQDKGRAYILRMTEHISQLNSINKSLITASLKLADQGGIEVLIALVQEQLDIENSIILQYIAEEMTKERNDTFSVIIDMLLPYDNTTVKIYCLDVIGKNKFVGYSTLIEQLAQDITQPSALRNKAKRISEVLSAAL